MLCESTYSCRIWFSKFGPRYLYSLDGYVGILIVENHLSVLGGMDRLLANECWQTEQLESRHRGRKITGHEKLSGMDGISDIWGGLDLGY